KLVGFFGKMQGAANSWLYQDPYDSSCIGQLLGYGDGSNRQFQLVRNTSYGMQDLIQFGFPSNVYINGISIPQAPQTSGQQWNLGVENLFLYSEVFDNPAVWILGNTGSSSNPLVRNNAAIAPNGTTTAATISFPSTSGSQTSYIYQSTSSESNTTYTFSIWLRVASGTANVEIQIGDLFAQSSVVVCNLSGIWSRFSVTMTTDSFPNSIMTGMIRQPPASSAVTVQSWGAQLERWSSPSGYNQTTTDQSFPNGLITFAGAPPAAQPITADFTFYQRCRFNTDSWDGTEQSLYQLWSISKVTFRSILL